MDLYHFTRNKKLKGFTRDSIYAWGSIENAEEWKNLNGGKNRNT